MNSNFDTYLKHVFEDDTVNGINIFLNANFDQKGMEDAVRYLKKSHEDKMKKWKVILNLNLLLLFKGGEVLL